MGQNPRRPPSPTTRTPSTRSWAAASTCRRASPPTSAANGAAARRRDVIINEPGGDSVASSITNEFPAPEPVEMPPKKRQRRAARAASTRATPPASRAARPEEAPVENSLCVSIASKDPLLSVSGHAALRPPRDAAVRVIAQFATRLSHKRCYEQPCAPRRASAELTAPLLRRSARGHAAPRGSGLRCDARRTRSYPRGHHAAPRRAPSSFNIQPWTCVPPCRSAAQRELVGRAALSESNRRRVMDAPLTAVFCADLEPARTRSRA